MDSKEISDNAISGSNNKTINTTFGYNQLKGLTLYEYFPMTDQDMPYLMDRYTDLSDLCICDFSPVSWPVPALSETVFVSFLEWVFKLEKCHIGIGGLSGETWFMNVWHTYEGTVEMASNDKRKATFTLDFLGPKMSFRTGANFILNLDQRRGNDRLKSLTSSEVIYAYDEDVCASFSISSIPLVSMQL